MKLVPIKLKLMRCLTIHWLYYKWWARISICLNSRKNQLKILSILIFLTWIVSYQTTKTLIYIDTMQLQRIIKLLAQLFRIHMNILALNPENNLVVEMTQLSHCLVYILWLEEIWLLMKDKSLHCLIFCLLLEEYSVFWSWLEEYVFHFYQISYFYNRYCLISSTIKSKRPQIHIRKKISRNI